jgi:hypothetical protein
MLTVADEAAPEVGVRPSPAPAEEFDELYERLALGVEMGAVADALRTFPAPVSREGGCQPPAPDTNRAHNGYGAGPMDHATPLQGLECGG